MQRKNINLKKLASFIVGVPAALIAVAEVEDLRFVWIRFAAFAVVIAVLALNGRKEKANA